jgi:hypothetical protein
MDTVFITFGAGRTGWRKASKRLTREAAATSLFSSIHCLDVDWLRSWDPEIYQIVETFRRNKMYRGFGYWTWKPAVLTWADLLFPHSQILYMDAGSHIDASPKQIQVFSSLLKDSIKSGGLAWHLPDHSDEAWTKRELIDLLNPPQHILKSNQVQSGFIMLPPSRQRTSLAKEWRDLASLEEGFYFSDELWHVQSKLFVEHRHDQSNLSLLWKKYDLVSRDDLTDPSNIGNFPIIAARNNSTAPLDQQFKFKTSAYTDLFIDKILMRR